MPKLKLQNVTLATVDTVCQELSEMALNECLKHADFDDVVILSDKRFINVNARTRQFYFEASNKEDVCKAYWHILPPLITTDYIFIIHWDSWILDPNQWVDDFLKYDYIGAPWYWHDDHKVGNSGFSIRSTRLANHLNNYYRCVFPDDAAICRGYRKPLEAEGFEFAPVALAGKFAYERWIMYRPEEIFGYHGIFNWPRILTVEQIHERLAKAPDYVKKSDEYVQMRNIIDGQVDLKSPQGDPNQKLRRAESFLSD